MKRDEFPARIRLNEKEADLLFALLWAHRQRVMAARRGAKAAGRSLVQYQRELAIVRNVYDELRLLADERGWNVVQHQPAHEEGADSEAAPRQSGTVGRRPTSSERGGGGFGRSSSTSRTSR